MWERVAGEKDEEIVGFQDMGGFTDLCKLFNFFSG